MNTDDLERRLRRLDPSQGVTVDPATGPRAAALMEKIMQTPDSAPTLTTGTLTTGSPEAPVRASSVSRRRWLRLALGGGIAAAVAVGAFVFGGGGGVSTATPVTYELGANDIMAMCLPVTDYVPPATGLVGFRGTVAELGDGTVTLDVTKWYAGGDSDRVVLQVADLASVALDGVEFAVGGDYLVSVMDGTVQICGLSGPYSTDFEAIFAGWFAA